MGQEVTFKIHLSRIIKSRAFGEGLRVKTQSKGKDSNGIEDTCIKVEVMDDTPTP